MKTNFSFSGASRKQKSVFKSSRRLKKRKMLTKKSDQSFHSNNDIENDLNLSMDSINEDISGSPSTRWEAGAEELSKISNLSRMENLVTELESGLLKEKENSNTDCDKNESFEKDLNVSSNSKSSTDLSPQLKSLVSFSKTFVLNSSYSRKVETPSCNERITVYKGSLSSPRNRNNHIRVLDFNTPSKLSNSKKNSPKARTNLQFSPSPKRKFLLNTNNRRLARTRSLTLPVQKSAPLESILESSREGIDSFIENNLIEKNISKEQNLCNISYNPREVEVDHSLLEGVHNSVLTASEFCTAKEVSSPKKTKAISLQTPGKESPLICLEPSTPFPTEITTASSTLANVPGTELNTPNPATMVPITVSTPCISSYVEENISHDSYYEPSEKSISYSINEDNIENALIKTAQLQEIEMEKLKPQEPQISPSKSQDYNESVQESNEKVSEDDSLFNGLLKNRPKYKLRKMTNKELGEAVEQEMNLLEQMRTLLEDQQKPNSNSEETANIAKTEELEKSAKESKKNRLFTGKGKCSSKHSSVLSRNKLRKPPRKTKSITYETFLNDFEVLKQCFIECLQKSHIESARTLLPYHLELFEKQKSYQSSFHEDKIVEHLIKMINYYSSPSMLRTMQQKLSKYKTVQKHSNCEEEISHDKSDGKNLPKKYKIDEKSNESNDTDISINILECEINVVVEGNSKRKPHLESKSFEDFQGRDNCVVDGTEVTSVDKLNTIDRDVFKEKEKQLTDSSSLSSKKLSTPLKTKQSKENSDKDLSLNSKNGKICHPKGDAENNQTVGKFILFLFLVIFNMQYKIKDKHGRKF